MIETSAVAWADAFLGTVGDAAATSADSLVEVERRVMHPADQAWRDLAPESGLLVVSWLSTDTADRGELARIAAEIGAEFPGAAVAQQGERGRILAAIEVEPDVEQRLERLRSRCADLVRSTPPRVRLVSGPVGQNEARQLLRDVG